MIRRIRQLAPCVAVFVGVAAAAAPGSGAAPVNKAVTLTVSTTIALDRSGCSGAAAPEISLNRGATAVTSTDCVVTFTTNSLSGAELRMSDASDTAALTYGTDFIPDISPDGALANGFGTCLASTPAADPLVTEGGTCSAASSVWFGLRQSIEKPVARTTGPGQGSARLRFGADVPLSQPPRVYNGTVSFTAVST